MLDWWRLKTGSGVHFDFGGGHRLANADLTKGVENQGQADSSDNVETKPLRRRVR